MGPKINGCAFFLSLAASVVIFAIGVMVWFMVALSPFPENPYVFQESVNKIGNVVGVGAIVLWIILYFPIKNWLESRQVNNEQ